MTETIAQRELNQSEPILTAESSHSFPPREPWSAVAVKLLQGVVYHDDGDDLWNAILAGVSPLTDYFGRLGLVLVVDESDGLAYLHQPDSEEWPVEYESMPKLFRNVPLSFEATLLCVLLRDELRRSDEDLQNERCVVAQSDLLASWQAFVPADTDSVRANRSLGAALSKLEDLKFVKQFENDPPSWEVRRLLRARLPLDKLQTIKQALQDEIARRSRTE